MNPKRVLQPELPADVLDSSGEDFISMLLDPNAPNEQTANNNAASNQIDFINSSNSETDFKETLGKIIYKSE